MSPASDTAPGRVEISFTLSQTANVGFDILANLPHGNDDSFYYKLDGGAWLTQNNASGNGWQTFRPTTFNNLTAGTHTLRILRREAGDAVQPRAGHRPGVFDCTLDALAELVRAAGQAGDPALALRHIAGGQVVQHHFDARLARAARHLRCRPGVGKLVFDVAKAGPRRGGETLEKVELGKEHGNVRRELRHNASIT